MVNPDRELLPIKGSFAAGEDVLVELRGSARGTVSLWHLGEKISDYSVDEEGPISFGALEAGGYGVEWNDGSAVVRTALDVQADPRARLRYGFVADFDPSRDPRTIAETVRRHHLTDVQFYDWAYRHADLLGGGQKYLDALGRPVSLQTVDALVQSVKSSGARALGYAAVYGVGPQEWEDWKSWALLEEGDKPYGLGDFLFIVDPAAPTWLAHFREQLSSATERLGFDGYHLDQYGYPKQARRADGRFVDVAASFDTLIRSVRERLPDAHLIFNNVNDFPTWVTGSSPQNGIYIEVWDPHLTLGALGHLADRAKVFAGSKPVAFAAYQHVYDTAPADVSDRATRLTMATLFSHGVTQLLVGEADRILVDPYYVRNHTVAASTSALLRKWYDFMVEHDEILFDPEIVEVTGSYAGPYNDDVDISYGNVAVTTEPECGAIWRRITKTRRGLVMHLINLAGQTNQLWDGPKEPVLDPGTGTLRVRTVDGSAPRIRMADPDSAARLVEMSVEVQDAHAVAQLPPPGAWQMVLIDNGDEDR